MQLNATVIDYRVFCLMSLSFDVVKADPAQAVLIVVPLGVVKIDLEAEFFCREVPERRRHLDHRHRVVVLRLDFCNS